jgi:hypothetical protein
VNNSLGLGWNGNNGVDLGFAINFAEGFDRESAVCGVFGRLNHNGSTYKASVNCDGQTKLFGSWKVCDKLSV